MDANERKSDMLVAKKALRERFKTLPADATDQQLKWYVRGFILDMLGNTMFADSRGDEIPLWYLNMVDNLDEPKNYNWGGAGLAYLYRNLCLASNPSCHSLLQHWS